MGRYGRVDVRINGQEQDGEIPQGQGLQKAVGGRRAEALPAEDSQAQKVQNDADDDDDEENDTVRDEDELQVVHDFPHSDARVKVSSDTSVF